MSSAPLRRLIAWQLLAVYVAAVLVCTVFSRGGYVRNYANLVKHVNFDLVGTIVSRLRGPYNLRAEVLLNLVMLFPVGFLLPPATGRGLKDTLLASVALVLVVEFAQLLLAKGSFELSDIAENVLSAAVGYLAWKVFELAIGRGEQPARTAGRHARHSEPKRSV